MRNLRPVLTGPTLWGAGLVIGAVGGVLVLEVQPAFGVGVALAWLALTWLQPRPIGLAGAIVGQALAWLALLFTGTVSCAATCGYSLPYGPVHSPDVDAWRASSWQWIYASAVMLVVGLALTWWSMRRNVKAV